MMGAKGIITLTTLLFLLLLVPTLTLAKRPQPHMVVIMADDLGWNDVGFRDRDMHTPNIDKLAREGVHMNYSYMQPVCSPSRAAFFTGYYPFRMGMQHSVLKALKNHSVPLKYRFMSEHLQELGYRTHFVGKWHLGFCRKEMTPTHRGFHTFYGMYTGKADFYNHSSRRNGYDFHDDRGDNYRVAWEANGTYSTTLFTKRALEIVEEHNTSQPLFLFLSHQAVHGPLQVPQEYITKYCRANVITGGENRRLRCAMVAAMDEGIGKVMDKLKARGLYDNLITLFISDNGGPVNLASSNWPLRGSKITLWEGGTRVVSILHSKRYLPDAPYNWNGLMHAVDWYPTLIRAAGDHQPVSGVDGVNNWWMILYQCTSRRDWFVYNINDVKNNSAIRYKQWKLVNNKPGSPDAWYNQPACVPLKPPPPRGKYPEFMLFNVVEDPEEDEDLAGDEQYADILEDMKSELAKYKRQIVNSADAPNVWDGKPELHNGTWITGWC